MVITGSIELFRVASLKLAMVLTVLAMCTSPSLEMNVTAERLADDAKGLWTVQTTVTFSARELCSGADAAVWTLDPATRSDASGCQDVNEHKSKVTATQIPPRADYTHYPGVGYYKLHTRKVEWGQAKNICEEEGAHLVIINSKAEEDVVRDMIYSRIRAAEVFVGFHDLFNEGEYLTVFGEPLGSTGYVNWEKGQPNDYRTQDCGSVVPSGEINDLSCSEKSQFLCELLL